MNWEALVVAMRAYGNGRLGESSCDCSGRSCDGSGEAEEDWW